MIFAIIFAEIFFLFERKNAIIKNRRLCDEIRWKSSNCYWWSDGDW